MGTESVLGHKLLCDLASKPTFDAPLNIDLSELLRFEIAVVRQLSAFTGERWISGWRPWILAERSSAVT